jgi:hypothetical protein
MQHARVRAPRSVFNGAGTRLVSCLSLAPAPASRTSTLGNLREGPQRIVNGSSIRKHSGNLRLEDDDVRTLSKTIDVFSTDQLTEIRTFIFGPEVIRGFLRFAVAKYRNRAATARERYHDRCSFSIRGSASCRSRLCFRAFQGVSFHAPAALPRFP